MNYDRKQFLKLSTGALLLSPLLNTFFDPEDPARIKTFGLQLYTLRDVLLNDPKNMLKQVGSFGYKQVESYEGPKGMFWGMSNTDFKKCMDDSGMVIISSHCDINKDFQKKVDDAAAIGMKYLLSSSFGARKNIDGYKRLAEQFNQCGEICKKAGIRFGYHGEDQDYRIEDGIMHEELFLQETDPSLVDFQMDYYWAVTGGQDPKALLKKYPNRFRLCHIKDRIKGATERNASCDLGQGSIDLPKILKAAMKIGMQYYFVEQERYDNSTPMKSVEKDAEYMKKLKI
jgi:sugar phosphate isomerase/epimerase